MSTIRPLVLSLALTFPLAATAADCSDRFETTKLDYLGRSIDNQKAYYITASNRADNYRLSAPGVNDIDLWSTTGPSIHVSASPVVLDDINGTHKLDRLKADGSYDCFLQSRNQLHPLIPPTWRPPARPDRPIAVKPENPDRPIVINPNLPDLPTAIKPGLPERPVAIKPSLPERPTVIRPELPERPVAIRPVQPDRPVAIRPGQPDRPTVIRPEQPDRPIAIRPVQPDRPIPIQPVQPDPSILLAQTV